MNQAHLDFLGSADWAEMLRADVLPWIEAESDRFSTATCFSMLHHIPEPATQDRLFAEVARMLRPGGTFLGIDSLDSEMIREFHVDDVFTPVDPATLPSRLEAAGFTDVRLEPDAHGFQVRFRATKP